MESFREMSKEELQAQEVEVNKKYQEFKDLHLSLNMARGKPAQIRSIMQMACLRQ